jgi:hypothetical protein
MIPKTMVFLFAALLACSIWVGKEASCMDLSRFHWKNRLLFIFAPQDGHPFSRALQSEIALQQDEVSERDLIVFKIFETGPSFMGTQRLDPPTATATRNKFAAPRGRFTSILVGKDGGVKLRRNVQTHLTDIFALIDAMPMRQKEMRPKARVKD